MSVDTWSTGGDGEPSSTLARELQLHQALAEVDRNHPDARTNLEAGESLIEIDDYLAVRLWHEEHCRDTAEIDLGRNRTDICIEVADGISFDFVQDTDRWIVPVLVSSIPAEAIDFFVECGGVNTRYGIRTKRNPDEPLAVFDSEVDAGFAIGAVVHREVRATSDRGASLEPLAKAQMPNGAILCGHSPIPFFVIVWRVGKCHLAIRARNGACDRVDAKAASLRVPAYFGDVRPEKPTVAQITCRRFERPQSTFVNRKLDYVCIRSDGNLGHDFHTLDERIDTKHILHRQVRWGTIRIAHIGASCLVVSVAAGCEPEQSGVSQDQLTSLHVNLRERVVDIYWKEPVLL